MNNKSNYLKSLIITVAQVFSIVILASLLLKCSNINDEDIDTGNYSIYSSENITYQHTGGERKYESTRRGIQNYDLDKFLGHVNENPCSTVSAEKLKITEEWVKYVGTCIDTEAWLCEGGKKVKGLCPLGKEVQCCMPSVKKEYTGSLSCRNGSISPSCRCPGKSGCCSHHGGVAGCTYTEELIIPKIREK